MDLAQWMLAGMFWFWCVVLASYFAYVAWFDRDKRERWRRIDQGSWAPYFPGTDDPVKYAIALRIVATVMFVGFCIASVFLFREAMGWG